MSWDQLLQSLNHLFYCWEGSHDNRLGLEEARQALIQLLSQKRHKRGKWTEHDTQHLSRDTESFLQLFAATRCQHLFGAFL